MYKPEIIAEIAQGFEGSVEQAKQLIKFAADAGASKAKIQIIFAEEQCTPDYKYYDLFKSLELSSENWREIYAYGNKLGIPIVYDIYGSMSITCAKYAGCKEVMIHASDLLNFDLIRRVEEEPWVDEVILGVGGAFLEEIKDALALLPSKKVTVMFGYQAGPTKPEDLGISRIEALAKLLSDNARVKIGYADHSDPDIAVGNDLSICALSNGATVFERHITSAKCSRLEDFESALAPDEFKRFVTVIHNFSNILDKRSFNNLSTSELQYRNGFRRQVVAAHDIKVGRVLQPHDLKLLRSANVGDFMRKEDLIDRKVVKDVLAGHPFCLQDLTV